MKAALVLLLDVDEDNVDALQPAYEAIAGAQLDGARHLHAFIHDCAEDLLDNLPPCCAEAMTPDPARAVCRDETTTKETP